MAPKRSSGRKLVASVVKTTRRVVEVVTGTGGATKTTTSDKKEIVEEVINGGGETETVEMTTTTTTTTATNTALETPTTTTIDIPVEDVEATTKAGKRSRRLVEKSPEAADLGQEEEDRISMGDDETETETQEPEFPMDDPKIYDISTPPRVEGPQKNQEKEEAQSGGKRTRTAQSEEEKTQKRRRRRMGVVGEGYKRYIHKVLKQVHPDLGISGKAMTVVNNFMSDMFERLAFEAGKLSDYGGRLTMTASEVQAAVKLVLPGELGKHAVAEGSKAVVTYMKGNS